MRPEKADDALRVGMYVGAGARSNGVCHWQMLMTLSPDIKASFLDEKSIAAGGLDGLDVLVMPGGSSYLEYDTLRKAGAVEKVKSFVRKGGGYVGTCAGACAILNGKRRLCMSPYVYAKNSRNHGTALLAMKFNDKAKSFCGIASETRRVRYSGGPVMEVGEKPVEGAKFETIATYDCDLVCEYGTNSVPVSMRGKAAAVCGTYGTGKVFAIATHPEYRADTLDILEGAFRYVSGRSKVRLMRPHRKPGDLCVAVYAPGTMGVDDANMIATLVTTPGLDVSFMNQPEEIGVGMLDHADVLVLPGGNKALYNAKYGSKTAGFIRQFLARGGEVLAVGEGARRAPKGAVACADRSELIERLKAKR